MPMKIEDCISNWQNSLLDTTKRNRLIKFSHGRAGMFLISPELPQFWELINEDNAKMLFPWKRDLLKIRHEDVEAWEESLERSSQSTKPSSIKPDVLPDNPEATQIMLIAEKRSLYEKPQPSKESQYPTTITEATKRSKISDRLKPNHILTEFTDRKLNASLLKLSRTASESEQEHGLSTLFLSFGFLKWYESLDSNEPIYSPLVLLQVKLEREAVDAPWEVSLEEDDPAMNHCLRQLMEKEFKIKLPMQENSSEENSELFPILDYFEQVRTSIKSMPRWEVTQGIGLGIFNFQKLAMWEDLEKNAVRIAQHPHCLAISGIQGTMADSCSDPVAAQDLDDKVHPKDNHQILVADSSQQEAIEQIKRGANMVVDGPPGTGKSQTIANTIAELIAQGKTVLFVSEKTAALEVVKKRLDERGLGDFCLPLHSNKTNKREILENLRKCLEQPKEKQHDYSNDQDQLFAVRKKLNNYVRELHKKRAPLNTSVYEIHGLLAKMDDVKINSKWAPLNLDSLDQEYLRKAVEILEILPKFQAIFADYKIHPWHQCKFNTISQLVTMDLENHLEKLTEYFAGIIAINAQQVLGVSEQIRTPNELVIGMELGRKILEVPLLPKEWFNKSPLVKAKLAGEIFASKTQLDESEKNLACFEKSFKDQVVPEKIKELVLKLNLTGEGAPNSTVSFRIRIEDLRKALTLYPKVQQDLILIIKAYNEATTILEITNRYATSQISEFSRFIKFLSKRQPIPEGWWDKQKRAELTGIAGRGASSQIAINDLRLKLITKISLDKATHKESAEVIREGLLYGGSWWRRFFPKWRELRSKISSWYLTRMPDLPTMLADLSDLEELCRHEDLINQLVSGYRDLWITSKDGTVDWQKNIEELKYQEKIEKVCKSESLKNKLGINGSLDRNALGRLGENLASTMEPFVKEWPDLACVFFPNEVSKSLEISPAQLLEKLQTTEAKLRVELLAWEEVIPQLESKLDISTGELKDKFTKLQVFAILRESLAKLVDEYKPESIDWNWLQQDWKYLSAAGKSLEAFIKQQPEPLNEKIVNVLYDKTVRDLFEKTLIEVEKLDLKGMQASLAYLAKSVFPFDKPSCFGMVIDSLDIAGLGQLFSKLGDRIDQLTEWVQFKKIYLEAKTLNLKIIVDEVLMREYPAGLASAIFRKRFYSLLVDELRDQVPELNDFSTEDHESKINHFNKLDQGSIYQASSEIRMKLLNSPHRPSISTLAPTTSGLGLLMRETQKKRKHLPLRKLFAQIPTILPRLKPCLMMSPLAVSTFLGSADWEFDVVIFDEASQVRPHDAICAVCRGKQLVVAGDPKQLPPTNFFEKVAFDDGTEGDGDEGTECFESLLDVCLTLGMRRQRLKWHYRSRKEGLIAFSNYHFYENSLITFPSAHENFNNPLDFTFLPDGTYENNVNVLEARKIAEMVMEHFQNSPKQSLGVIAFSVSQQNRILDELEIQRRTKPHLEEFFSPEKPERFFVKNLENVQGDERDVIFLGVGYGPNSARKVFMRFGPLNLKGGERRLNVAVTRARAGMKVISSMMPDQINLSNTNSLGAKLLRSFLDYAARGTVALSQAITSTGPGSADSPFEEAVCDALTQRGLKLQKQVGCGGFRIDLAVLDDKIEGKYLLGIECDGATYHSSATARDRDRLRQQVLEGLGWSICRIWSTDWVQNRERQIQRVLDALARVRNGSYSKMPISVPVKETNQQLLQEEIEEEIEQGFDFKSIDDVPPSVILELIQKTLVECGATERMDLMKTISQKLGFKRLGTNIEKKINKTLSRQLLKGRLQEDANEKLSWRSQESWIQPEIQE